MKGMNKRMQDFIVFLHVLGAVGMGFYLIFPFLTMKISSLNKQAQEGYVQALVTANRFGQFLLILQLLTGGYLIGKDEADVYSTVWMITAIVLLVLVGAFGGMLGGPLKRIANATQTGAGTEKDISKITMFSILLAVVLLAIVVLMVYPSILA